MWGFFLRIPLKKLLHAESTNLCAGSWISSSLTNVMSKRSSSSLKFAKDLDTVGWKSFHFRQNFSEFIVWRMIWADRNTCNKTKKLTKFELQHVHVNVLEWKEWKVNCFSLAFAKIKARHWGNGQKNDLPGLECSLI